MPLGLQMMGIVEVCVLNIRPYRFHWTFPLSFLNTPSAA
jgi:hypothetical protein